MAINAFSLDASADGLKLACLQSVPDAKAGNLSIDTLGNKDCTGPAKQDNFRICWP